LRDTLRSSATPLANTSNDEDELEEGVLSPLGLDEAGEAYKLADHNGRLAGLGTWLGASSRVEVGKK